MFDAHVPTTNVNDHAAVQCQGWQATFGRMRLFALSAGQSPNSIHVFMRRDQLKFAHQLELF